MYYTLLSLATYYLCIPGSDSHENYSKEDNVKQPQGCLGPEGQRGDSITQKIHFNFEIVTLTRLMRYTKNGAFYYVCGGHITEQHRGRVHFFLEFEVVSLKGSDHYSMSLGLGRGKEINNKHKKKLGGCLEYRYL